MERGSASIISLVLYILVCLSSFWITAEGGFVATTSRQWAAGEEANLCIFFTDAEAPSRRSDTDRLSFSVKDDIKIIIPPTPIPVNYDEQVCQSIQAPNRTVSPALTIELTGIIDENKVFESVTIPLVYSDLKTFVETDKYLYKPLQTVNFRILSIKGPFLNVSKEEYPEITIENPGGSRLKQWLDVKNPKGLLHLSYQLSDEPEQGIYKISVRNAEGNKYTTNFKIENFVLPRFEVSILPPKYILGISRYEEFKVCAEYTFGQPVKGLIDLELGAKSWWGQQFFTNQTRKNIPIEMNGCKTFNLSIEDFFAGESRYYRTYVNLKAWVTEEGTGVKLAAPPVSIQLEFRVIKFSSRSLHQYLKPGLPYFAQISATFPDGSPASNERMEVCTENKGVCKNFTTDTGGLLRFAIPAHIRPESFQVTSLGYPAKTVNQSYILKSDFYQNLGKTYYSPSNSSLSIGLFEKELKCTAGEDIAFELPVQYSSSSELESAKINVQVVSRGSIQFSHSFIREFNSTNTNFGVENDAFLELPKEESENEVQSGFFTIPISLPKTTSPNAKILVWYARDNGEIVSDSVEIDITECLLNNVFVKWSAAEAQPGQDEKLTVSALPDSICSLGIVDKSVILLDSENREQISVGGVVKLTSSFVISKFTNPQLNEEEYCKRVIESQNSSKITDDSDPDTDMTTTPTTTTTTPIYYPYGLGGYNRYFSEDVDAQTMFHEAGLMVMTDLVVILRRCQKQFEDYGFSHVSGTRPFFLTTTRFSTMVAFAPTGIPEPPPPPAIDALETAPVTAPESSSPRTFFPETWLWQLVVMPQSGTFQQNLTLPDTVTEWVGKAVCVHPSEGVGISQATSIVTFRDFFVDINLPPTAKRGEVLTVKISVFNYLNQSFPVKLLMHDSPEFDILSNSSNTIGSGQRSSCIPAHDKTVHSIVIRPKEVGNVNITIDAIVDAKGIQNCAGGSLVERRDALIKPIKVDFEGFPREKTWTEYFCPHDKDGIKNAEWSLMTPPNIVEDSGRGYVMVSGDMMGPTIENLAHLVRMPYGCGEQNMVGFAPNIFVTQYLEASNQTTQKIIDQAVSFMDAGYKRELNYRHEDGSYSAFGKSDASGSTWLTSFVLKCFALARPYIEINNDDLQISKSWLKGLQNKTDGCFSSVGNVLHKGMKGGLGNSHASSLLSAFVTISLLEAGEFPLSEEIKGALSCIKSDPGTAPYGLAVKSYALALAGGETLADKFIKDLLSQAVVSRKSMHWETQNEAERSQALSVETAGYAVLALLLVNPKKYRTQASKIVNFINTKRNGQGGFISTQDTIVALQALAEYEKAFPQSSIKAEINVDMNGAKAAFTVTEKNKLLVQRAKLPGVPTNVTVSARGTGCILVQAVLRYNEPKPDASEAFNLVVEATTEPDKGCKTKRIKACVSYQLADFKSNMAIIEIDVMTGYIPDKGDLKRIVATDIEGYGDVFKRYEVDGSKVLFYVDGIIPLDLCASFKVFREFEVEEAKDGSVTVYDYYNPNYSVSQRYRLPPSTECKKLIEPPIEGTILKPPSPTKP